MLKFFKSYPAMTCLLDDFDFYENREKLFCCQRSTERTRPEQEVYSNNNYHHVSPFLLSRTRMLLEIQLVQSVRISIQVTVVDSLKHFSHLFHFTLSNTIYFQTLLFSFYGCHVSKHGTGAHMVSSINIPRWIPFFLSFSSFIFLFPENQKVSSLCMFFSIDPCF